MKAEIVASANVTAFQSGTSQTSFVPVCSAYVPSLFKKYFRRKTSPATQVGTDVFSATSKNDFCF